MANLSFKSILDVIKLYWGYATTLLAIGTFIWTLGVKSERKNNEKISLKEDLIEIKRSQNEQKRKMDSILFIINDIKVSQENLLKDQNALKNSYIDFVANFNDFKNKGLTTKEFLEYMKELQPTNTLNNTPKKDTLVIKKYSIGVR